jgi:glutathione S-transferase
MAESPLPLRVLGTTTSPYTRKVRILAAAAGAPFDFIDTRQPIGAALLARVAPLGKVPALMAGDGDDALVLPDSSLISHWLWARHAATLRAAGFVLDPEAWHDRALQIAVEGALDAAINRFYLLRDGSHDGGYVTRQGERVATTLAWLDAHVTFGLPCTFATLSLGCALDWMVFRKVGDVARYRGLVAFREAWAASGIGAGTEPG